MKTLLGTFGLYNRRTELTESAELFYGIAENNLVDFETKWIAAYKARLPANPSPTDIINNKIDAIDKHWNWRSFYQYSLGVSGYDFHVVECGGITQGLMVVNTLGIPSKHPDSKSLPLHHIERLSTAPWNRSRFITHPIYRGVGELLIGAAVEYSISEDYEGRIGLESVPESESYYTGIGMSDVGIHATTGLREFEFSEAQAKAYISPPANIEEASHENQ